MKHIQLSHVSAVIDLKWTKVAAENYITNEKKRSERCKHCALAVVRQSQTCSARHRPIPGGAGQPNFNQLEMVTTFTYRPSLVKIDGRNFELIVVTDPQTHKQTDRANYNTLQH